MANEKMTNEKRQALEDALAKIEKQFGKGAIMRMGEGTQMSIEAIPTGALGLDIALGVGGVPRGRIIEVYGPESSGKTTLTLHIVAEAQKNNTEQTQAFQPKQEKDTQPSVFNNTEQARNTQPCPCDNPKAN